MRSGGTLARRLAPLARPRNEDVLVQLRLGIDDARKRVLHMRIVEFFLQLLETVRAGAHQLEVVRLASVAKQSPAREGVNSRRERLPSRLPVRFAFRVDDVVVRRAHFARIGREIELQSQGTWSNKDVKILLLRLLLRLRLLPYLAHSSQSEIMSEILNNCVCE